MNFDERLLATLESLKGAFISHIQTNTPASSAALDLEIGRFKSFVQSNRGALRERNECVALIEAWNTFVSAVQARENPSEPTRLLFDAIDRVAASISRKMQAPPAVVFQMNELNNNGVFVHGSDNQLQNLTFHQNIGPAPAPVDFNRLADELALLREAMRSQADSLEKDMAVGSVAAAEMAARSGNEKGMFDHLKSAGSWAFDVATKIGVGIAIAVLKDRLGNS